jgi:hypothetical protein
MLSDLDTALLPGIGNEFGVEVTASLAGERRAERMVQGNHDPTTGTKERGERSQWHTPLLQVVKGKGAGDPIDSAGVEGNRLGEVRDEKSTTSPTPRSSLLNHGWAQVKTDDLSPFIEHPFALRSGTTASIQNRQSRERARYEGTHGRALQEAVEWSFIRARRPHRGQPVIRRSGYPGVLFLILWLRAVHLGSCTRSPVRSSGDVVRRSSPTTGWMALEVATLAGISSLVRSHGAFVDGTDKQPDGDGESGHHDATDN